MAHAYGKLYITLWIYIRHRIKTYASIECVFACKRWRTRKSALCSQRRLLSRVFFFLLLLLMPEVIKNLIKRNSYGRLLSWAALCSTEEGFHSIETDLEKSSSSRVSFRFKFFPHVFFSVFQLSSSSSFLCPCIFAPHPSCSANIVFHLSFIWASPSLPSRAALYAFWRTGGMFWAPLSYWWMKIIWWLCW